MATSDEPAERAASDERRFVAEQKRLSRTEFALMEIQRRLVRMEYAPGSTFTETEMASAVGATRTPVREALLLLAADGLVSPRAGAGYLVRPITLKDVRSVFAHCRRLLPDGVGLLATRGVSGATLADLSDELEGVGYARHEDRFEQFTTFYTLLMNYTEDSLLGRDFGRLAIELERLLRLALPDDQAIGLGPEKELLRAVSSDAPAAARKLVTGRMTDLEAQVQERILGSEALMSANLGMAPRTP